MTRCPACSALLYRRVVSNVEVDGCPACGGIWLDKGELHALAKDPATLRAVEKIFVPGGQATKPERNGLCPRCQTPLTPFEYDSFRGVRLDRCKPCGGLFLDYGEAGQIAEILEKAAAPVPYSPPTVIDLSPGDAEPSPASPSPALSTRFGPPGAQAAATAPVGDAPFRVAATVPVHAPATSVPASVGLDSQFWETLRSTDYAQIQQQFEIAEMFGFETRNKYAIRTESAYIGWAAEQGKSVLGMIARQYLGHWRTFEIHIFDAQRQPALVAVHPFRFLFQRLEVRLADGTPLGALQQRFSLWSKRFDVEDATGRVIMTVNSPFWRLWTFPFMRRGEQVAVIEKKWSGFLTEGFTDKDKFMVRFGAGVSDRERALLVAAGLFIDLLYFETKASN